MTCCLNDTIEEVVYADRDNKIVLSLTVDDIPIVHNLILRCQIKAGETLLDSDVDPTFFDFTNANKLILKLGFANVPVGKYDASLFVFDYGNPNGLFWHNLKLTFF